MHFRYFKVGLYLLDRFCYDEHMNNTVFRRTSLAFIFEVAYGHQIKANCSTSIIWDFILDQYIVLSRVRLIADPAMSHFVKIGIIRADISRRQRNAIAFMSSPSCPLSLPWCHWNAPIEMSSPGAFTKENMPWCPCPFCPFKNEVTHNLWEKFDLSNNHLRCLATSMPRLQWNLNGV